MTNDEGLYIALLSLHGLIRGENLELGRDPDTGGQVLYVVELARALAKDKRVARVDLFTRKVVGKKVSEEYAQPVEDLGHGAQIIRVPFGPNRYLRKENLWPYLDVFVDGSMSHFQRVKRVPDVVHGHYADAGQAGAQMARILGVPFIFTGHSLGKVKKQRMAEDGKSGASFDRKFSFERRFEAEELALDTAELVVTSTRQEVKEQYELYDHYEPERMEVIPPGVNLDRFSQAKSDAGDPPYFEEIKRFLHEPEKPMILAMARPDERKNFHTLIKAYGENQALRDKANLVLIAGKRDDIRELDKGSRHVLIQILNLIDTYDLYGSVAYPKHHQSTDVPDIYRIAARSHGVFVNPALTEPFGLTLIEAAASGLPIIATNDGGPNDIIGACQNGALVDPLDSDAIGEALLNAVSDRTQWDLWSKSGLECVKRHYAWGSHATKYLTEVERILKGERPSGFDILKRRNRLPGVDRILVTDIDNTLTGDPNGLNELLASLEANGNTVGFGIATGRNLKDARQLLAGHQVPDPDIFISSVGTQIHYGKDLAEDKSWKRQINYHWQPDEIRKAIEELPGLTPNNHERYKLAYEWNSELAPSLPKIKRHLRQQGLIAKVIFSLGMFLDIIPIRGGDGLAIRHLGHKWGLPPERWLIAGDSGNDEEMLKGNTLGVVVGNFSPELAKLRGMPGIYFAQAHHARGILEGMDYYDFFGEFKQPQQNIENV